MNEVRLTGEERLMLKALYRRALARSMDWEMLAYQAANNGAHRAFIGHRSDYLPYDPDRLLQPWQREMNVCWREAFSELAAEQGLALLEEQVHRWELYVKPSSEGKLSL